MSSTWFKVFCALNSVMWKLTSRFHAFAQSAYMKARCQLPHHGIECAKYLEPGAGHLLSCARKPEQLLLPAAPGGPRDQPPAAASEKHHPRVRCSVRPLAQLRNRVQPANPWVSRRNCLFRCGKHPRRSGPQLANGGSTGCKDRTATEYPHKDSADDGGWDALAPYPPGAAGKVAASASGCPSALAAEIVCRHPVLATCRAKSSAWG